MCIRERPGGIGQAWVEERGEEVDLVFRKRGMGGRRAEEDRVSQIDRSSHVGPGDFSAEAQPIWKPPEPARHALGRPHAFWITCWHGLPSWPFHWGMEQLKLRLFPWWFHFPATSFGSVQHKFPWSLHAFSEKRKRCKRHS